MTGRADYLALGDYNAVCYECGRKFKASELKRHWQGYYVCPAHFEPRQPQDFVRNIPDVQTPPWAQPMPADTFRMTEPLCVENTADDSVIFYALATETGYPLQTET